MDADDVETCLSFASGRLFRSPLARIPQHVLDFSTGICVSFAALLDVSVPLPPAGLAPAETAGSAEPGMQLMFEWPTALEVPVHDNRFPTSMVAPVYPVVRAVLFYLSLATSIHPTVQAVPVQAVPDWSASCAKYQDNQKDKCKLQVGVAGIQDRLVLAESVEGLASDRLLPEVVVESWNVSPFPVIPPRALHSVD